LHFSSRQQLHRCRPQCPPSQTVDETVGANAPGQQSSCWRMQDCLPATVRVITTDAPSSLPGTWRTHDLLVRRNRVELVTYCWGGGGGRKEGEAVRHFARETPDLPEEGVRWNARSRRQHIRVFCLEDSVKLAAGGQPACRCRAGGASRPAV